MIAIRYKDCIVVYCFHIFERRLKYASFIIRMVWSVLSVFLSCICCVILLNLLCAVLLVNVLFLVCGSVYFVLLCCVVSLCSLCSVVFCSVVFYYVVLCCVVSCCVGLGLIGPFLLFSHFFCSSDIFC